MEWASHGEDGMSGTVSPMNGHTLFVTIMHLAFLHKRPCQSGLREGRAEEEVADFDGAFLSGARQNNARLRCLLMRGSELLAKGLTHPGSSGPPPAPPALTATPATSIPSRAVRCGLQAAASPPRPLGVLPPVITEWVHVFLACVRAKHPKGSPGTVPRTLDGDTWWNVGYAFVARRAGERAGEGVTGTGGREGGREGRREESEEGGRCFGRCSETHASSCHYFDSWVSSPPPTP
ncbi:hypothetical protein E2C01_058678 [Portunus trituberculatus]|uniref:Uncharacterized protein n=1 Tax=Portunus trituberculatus TaxID=210409 RepID=A0A5B7GX50_PORTR|nr:hypothetical protein [Portunus trituberculatus]